MATDPYIAERPGGARAIEGVATSIAAFVGHTPSGPLDAVVELHDFARFERDFGGLDRDSPMACAVQQFFANGGEDAWIVRVAEGGDVAQLIAALQRLREIGLFNLLCVPETFALSQADAASVIDAASRLCEEMRAFLIVDPPVSTTQADIVAWAEGATTSRNAAVYFPHACIVDPFDGAMHAIPASGAIAGIYARTDYARGVWKAPAGTHARLSGVIDLSVHLDDQASGVLNVAGVNALRMFPENGPIVWGARTRRGADAHADDYKYVPVRRLALFIEESVCRGTQWALFEPTGDALWSRLRLDATTFMHGLWRQGAFQGRSPNEGYFVKCDASTTTQSELDMGFCNLLIGFAPLKPAEFVQIVIRYATSTTA